MNTYLILLGVLLYLISVNARHFDDQSDHRNEELTNVNRRENGGHRRKRYHMSYGYDYTPPANPFYPSRREYDRNQDLLPEIHRLLDDISAYVRRPPPPTLQPIYIPYAVPYPMCNCQGMQQPTTPNITSRFPSMDDTNQNWGLIDDGVAEEEGDGTRPISFIPIQPKRPLSRPPTSLDHGTQNARAPSSQTTQSPTFARPPIPDMCKVFSLSCCGGNSSQQKQCFINAGCAETYDNGKGCEQDRLLKIIDEYSRAYAPTVN